jgi:hypothetical protein
MGLMEYFWQRTTLFPFGMFLFCCASRLLVLKGNQLNGVIELISKKPKRNLHRIADQSYKEEDQQEPVYNLFQD